MLVCENFGMSAEALKKVRRDVCLIGFNCVQGKKGRLYFSTKESDLRLWQNLLKYLSREPKIMPVFFEDNNRLIKLQYGLECVQMSMKDLVSKIFLQGLKGFIQISLKQRVQFINNIKKDGE